MYLYVYTLQPSQSNSSKLKPLKLKFLIASTILYSSSECKISHSKSSSSDALSSSDKSSLSPRYVFKSSCAFFLPFLSQILNNWLFVLHEKLIEFFLPNNQGISLNYQNGKTQTCHTVLKILTIPCHQ